MSEYLDTSLDEIIKIQKQQKMRNRINKGQQNNQKKLFVRNSIKKGFQEFNQQRHNKPQFNYANNFEERQQNKPKQSQKIINRINFKSENKQNNKIFVSNLDSNITNKDLQELFSSCGKLVKLGLLWDNLGNSQGQAFIQYDQEESARKALENFDGAELDGKIMKVVFHNEK